MCNNVIFLLYARYHVVYTVDINLMIVTRNISNNEYQYLLDRVQSDSLCPTHSVYLPCSVLDLCT